MSRATLIERFDEYCQNAGNRTKSNSILHKENQNIKWFSAHNHFELTQSNTRSKKRKCQRLQ